MHATDPVQPPRCGPLTLACRPADRSRQAISDNARVEIAPLVLHVDEHLIALNKPAGISTTPDLAGGPSLQELVARYLDGPAYIVHRLDRGTSGILVFAREREEHRRLSMLFESRSVTKRYLALVAGHLDREAGEIEAPLRTFGSGRVGVDPRGRPSRTRYSLIERLVDDDLLAVEPETGRRHQVRVHLYSIGHPVLGDPRYGEERPVGGMARLMLHALELTIPGANATPLVLRAEPGRDFLDVMDTARRGRA